MLTPIQLQRNLTKGISQVNRLVKESLEKDDLAELNRQNLLLGKDSKGGDMPPYSDNEYAAIKHAMNYKNRGLWDLKWKGNYHRGITVSITSNAVRFFQRSKANSVILITPRLELLNIQPLGLPQKQIEQIQLENIPELRQKLLNIILNV